MKPVQNEASITMDLGACYKGRGSLLLQLGHKKQGEGLFYPTRTKLQPLDSKAASGK